MTEHGERISAPINMHDVAARAGVSQRTVSNVVNNYQHVRPATRARVQQAIDELGYRPNVSAQRLRQGRTGLIALAVPEIAAPYFAELADLLQRSAEQRGLTLLIDQTGGTRTRELQVLDGYQSNLIDGLILSPMAITAEDLAQQVHTVPTVLLGESIDRSGLLHVSIDNVEAAGVATRHLLDRGRTRIVALGAHQPVDSIGPAGRRLRGYLKAMESAGLGEMPELILRGNDWSRRDGFDLVRQALDDGIEFDAIFCFNDVLALGAMKALLDAGISIPDEVSVVGWDDIEEAAYANPALTSITPDKQAIAATALDSLLDRISGVRPARADITVGFTLTQRQSSLATGDSVRLASPSGAVQ
jgi:DNA-binding LacI/PurR family transcriptional regulator